MRKIIFFSTLVLATILLGRGEILLRSIDLSNFPHISVSFSVKRPDGFYETNLSSSEIVIKESNGKSLDFSLKRERSDVYMVIAIDVSGSLKRSLPNVKALVKQLIEKLAGFDLKIAICEFGYNKQDGIKIYGSYNIRYPDSQKKILGLIESFKAYGSTPLYDAIYQSLNYIENENGSGAVLVFSDGFDEDFEGKKRGSSLRLDKLLKLRSKIVVHTIGIPGSKGINEDVLRKISKNFHGLFFKFDREHVSNKYLEEIRKRILESIKNIYTVEFNAKYGEYATLKVNKLDYFAETKIVYPKKLKGKSEEIFLPAGYRGVVKFEIEGDEIKKESEKSLGCFVDGVYPTDGKIIAYCDNSIKILDKNLEILKSFDISGVVIGFAIKGRVVAGLIGKGLVFVDDKRKLFECNLRSADIEGDTLLLNCKNRVVLINLNNLEKTVSIPWKSSMKSLGTKQGNTVISDYENGLYLIKGAKTTLLKKVAGVNDFEYGYYINGLSSELVAPNGKESKLSFYPVKLIKKGNYLFILGWLGEIAVYDKSLTLREFIPSLSVPKLVVYNGKVNLLSAGTLYELSNGCLRKINVAWNGKIYDVKTNQESTVYALGNYGIIIENKGSQISLNVPSYRTGWVGNAILTYNQNDLLLLNTKGKIIDTYHIDDLITKISISRYGACIPTKSNIIVIKNGLAARIIKIGLAEDCAVAKDVVYVVKNDLEIVDLNGKILSRIAIPDFPSKIVLCNDKPFVLTSTGNLIKIDRGTFRVVKRSCIDAICFNGSIYFLTKVEGRDFVIHRLKICDAK